jgi:hypothetical protein
MVHGKELRLSSRLRFHIAIDTGFWVIGFGIGQLHTTCLCWGLSVQFGPFHVELFTSRQSTCLTPAKSPNTPHKRGFLFTVKSLLGAQ